MLDHVDLFDSKARGIYFRAILWATWTTHDCYNCVSAPTLWVYHAELNGKEPMSPKQLRALRTRLKLSLREFGAQVGVSKTTIYCWESGRTPIPHWMDFTSRPPFQKR
jgi:DNA-binding XRE family transcriptional regulator